MSVVFRGILRKSEQIFGPDVHLTPPPSLRRAITHLSLSSRRRFHISVDTTNHTPPRCNQAEPLANMVSMDQIGYDNVSRVLESWDAARRTGKDLSFEKDFGKLLIDK